MTPEFTAPSRALLWRRLVDEPGLELARWARHEQGVELAGRVFWALEGAPLEVTYRIVCDASWTTRRVEVEQAWRGAVRTLRLDHDGQGGWRRDGAGEPSLAGCLDVDLGITPATNALPVNRLRPAIGEHREIAAAWVLFPGLQVVAAEQGYDRLSERQYRYSALGGSGFSAVLGVDEDGFPIDYPGIWRREAEGVAAPEVSSSGFARTLLGGGETSLPAEAAQQLGWLVGGWGGRVREFERDGHERAGRGEWWFAWVLEGRAIQDVFVVPPPSSRHAAASSGPEAVGNRYGTTLRWLDHAESGRWRIVWVNPVTGAVSQLAGQRKGDRIVLVGEEDGRAARWSFTDIRPDSFVWRGESRDPDGSWHLDVLFEMRRIA
ncbi:MAG: putative glycolipid-binding domain-containing protein [Candidatus Dormibacteraceae bacterium]